MNLQDLLLERIESAMVGVRNPRTKAVLKFDLIADIGERTHLTIIPYKMTELKFEPTVKSIRDRTSQVVQYSRRNTQMPLLCVCHPSTKD